MKNDKSARIGEYLKALFDKYKYVLAVCALGLALVLWPQDAQNPAPSGAAAGDGPALYDAEALSDALAKAFEAIEGVGQTKVLLTVKSGYEQVYVYDQTRQTAQADSQSSSSIQTQLVTVSGGGEQSPVVQRVNYPVFMGAVVICEGGGSSRVKLELTQAIRSLTGISADNIVITKMKQ